MGTAQLIYTGVKYDSKEEIWFAMWLQELMDAGYVQRFQKTMIPMPLTEGLTFQYEKVTKLKTKVKTETKTHILLRPSEYTPDFQVIFTDKGKELFLSEISNNPNKDKLFFYTGYERHVFFEIKPSFDQNNMERLFRNNQKFIWDKHKIFVNLVEPIELFKKTFLPLQAQDDFKYKKAPTGKNKGKKSVGDWKMDWTPKTLKEFLCSLSTN